MVFAKQNGILIKVLTQSKGYSARKFVRWRNFLTRTCLVQHWTDFFSRLTLQGLQTGSPAAAENVRSAQETRKCLCKWDHFEHKL